MDNLTHLPEQWQLKRNTKHPRWKEFLKIISQLSNGLLEYGHIIWYAKLSKNNEHYSERYNNFNGVSIDDPKTFNVPIITLDEFFNEDKQYELWI